MTQEKSVVLDVEVQHRGETYRASYFVEGDIVHANIGGRVLRSPLGNGNAADKVRSLLEGHLLLQTRKAHLVNQWSRDRRPPPPSERGNGPS